MAHTFEANSSFARVVGALCHATVYAGDSFNAHANIITALSVVGAVVRTELDSAVFAHKSRLALTYSVIAEFSIGVVAFVGAGDFIAGSANQPRVAETNPILTYSTSVAVIGAFFDFAGNSSVATIADNTSVQSDVPM